MVLKTPMLAAALLNFQGFKARSLMPAADADQAAGVTWKKSAADASAATALGEQPIGQVVAAGQILEIVFRPLTSLAHDAANYATLTIYKRTGGGAPVVVAQLATSALDWTASIPVIVPLVAGAIAAGDLLTFAIAKTSSGVIVPQGTLAMIATPNYCDFAIARWQSRIFGYLRKRYDVTKIDADNPPEIILDWIVKCVMPDMYRKRGVNPSDTQMATLIDDRNDAIAEVKLEASDAATGLIELPLLSDEKQTGVSQGGPYGYSEATPYAWTDQQVVQAIENGEGLGIDSELVDDGRELITS